MNFEDGLELLDAQLHPLTRVRCDEDGFIHYERDNADDIVLGWDQNSSRLYALHRLKMVYAFVGMDLPNYQSDMSTLRSLSSHYLNFSYRDYADQTVEAVTESKIQEAKKLEHVRQLHRREGDWNWRPRPIG